MADHNEPCGCDESKRLTQLLNNPAFRRSLNDQIEYLHKGISGANDRMRCAKAQYETALFDVGVMEQELNSLIEIRDAVKFVEVKDGE